MNMAILHNLQHQGSFVLAHAALLLPPRQLGAQPGELGLRRPNRLRAGQSRPSGSAWELLHGAARLYSMTMYRLWFKG